MIGAVRRVSAGAVAKPLAEARDERLLAAWSALERSRTELQPQAVDLAFRLAERVVGEAARLDRAAVLAALGDALATTGPAAALLVRAHVDDVAACREALAVGPFAFEVVADVAVPRGGVVVESSRGVVDARVAVRLERLRALLEASR